MNTLFFFLFLFWQGSGKSFSNSRVQIIHNPNVDCGKWFVVVVVVVVVSQIFFFSRRV